MNYSNEQLAGRETSSTPSFRLSLFLATATVGSDGNDDDEALLRANRLAPSRRSSGSSTPGPLVVLVDEAAVALLSAVV